MLLSSSRSARTRRTRDSLAAHGLRLLGAVALLAVGYVHLKEYRGGYSGIPTIGTLFLLNAISAAVVAVALAAPVAQLRRADPLLTLSGVAISLGALVGLVVSEQTPLFGFMEVGYRTVIVQAIAAEAIATVALVGFLLLRRRHDKPRRVRITAAWSRG